MADHQGKSNGRGSNGRNGRSRYAHIIGWGMALPTRVMTNDEIAQMVDTSDAWIRERTGIRERRIAGAKDSTATLALRAAKRALEVANVSPADLNLIIVATATPEYLFPATACLVQDWLGAENAGAFDLSAGCTGFVYALSLAAQTIISGAADTVLVIGSETLSRIVDWQDRGTCILFGDGAGAVVLRASNMPGGVLTTLLRSDGSGGELLALPGGGSRYPPSPTTVLNGMHKIHMNGREVFRFATRVMAQATRSVVEDAGLTLEDIALVIPHQANIRIIEAAARNLGMPMEKMYVNIERYGNTSSASIPIALCEAIESGRIKADDIIVLVAFGAGLTWGAATIKWVPTPPPASPLEQRAHAVRYWWAALRSAWRRFWRRLESWLKGPATASEK